MIKMPYAALVKNKSSGCVAPYLLVGIKRGEVKPQVHLATKFGAIQSTYVHLCFNPKKGKSSH